MESGERKTSCDIEALKAIKEVEIELEERFKKQHLEYQNNLAVWDSEYNIIVKGRKKDQESKKMALNELGEKPSTHPSPIILLSDPTFEGLCKLLANGYPSIGLFSSEGGQFTGGYSMKQENKIATAASLSSMWDDGSIKRIRASEIPISLRGKRLSVHLMVQPRIADN